MEKRGLNERLEEEGLLEDLAESGVESDAGAVFFGDEMRVGLIGQVRRCWFQRGVKVCRPVEFAYEWSYLNLAVDPLEGA